MKPNTIRRTALILLFAFALMRSGRAQESSIQFGIGYGFSSGSQLLGQDKVVSSGRTTTTGVYGSLGSGFNISASYRRMFSENIGVDLGAIYHMGRSFESIQKTSSASSSTATSESEAVSADGFSLEPSIVLAANVGNFMPYAKAGLTLGWIVIENESVVSVNAGGSTQSAERKVELGGGASLGFRSGFGVMFNPAKDIRFFSEVMFTSMTTYPAEAEVVQLTINHLDKINSLTTAARYAVFKPEVTSTTTASPSDQPTEILQRGYPMGSLQFNVGLYFLLKTK